MFKTPVRLRTKAMAVCSMLVWQIVPMLVSADAHAQAAAPSQAAADQAAADQKVAQGRLRIFLFDAATGLPKGGMALQVADQSQTSSSDGQAMFELEAGRYVLMLGSTQEPVVVVAGGTSELVLELEFSDSGDPAIVHRDVETALEDAPAQAADSDAVAGLLLGAVAGTKGEPISGAQIFVLGQPGSVQSDGAGHFEVQAAAGPQTITVLRSGFRTQTLQVNVPPRAEASLKRMQISMPKAQARLKVVRVVVPRISTGAAAFLQIRRASDGVADAIGAEQMSKSGDSDAASALGRVTGLTIVDDRFVYIRGMGDRYVGVQMNGISLPSPEPERRVIPLNVFPAKLLDGIVVRKAFTPDMPSEFGGGWVQLKTRGIPDDGVYRLTLSLGGHSQTTFQDAHSYDGGSLDGLGFDDGTRALPAEVREASANERLVGGDRFGNSGYTQDELERFGELMANTWRVRRVTASPDLAVSATAGDKFSWGSVPMGYLVSATYNNRWRNRIEERAFVGLGDQDAVETQAEYLYDRSTNTVGLGLVGTLNAEFSERHKVSTTTILVRSTEDETRFVSGFNDDVDTEIRLTRQRMVARTLWSQQFHGKHKLLDEKLGFDWSYGLSLGLRDEPDRRETRYDFDPVAQVFFLSDRPEGNQRFFSGLTDWTHDLKADFVMPLQLSKAIAGDLKMGAYLRVRNRSVEARRYKYNERGERSADLAVTTLPAHRLFAPENIGPDGFQFTEITRSTDNYTANQQLAAAYAMLDVRLLPDLQLIGGVRLAYGRQAVSTFELFSTTSTPIEAVLGNLDILPALLLNYDLKEDLKLRFSVSRTVTRPEFRELSPATFNPVTGGRQVFGNPDLERGTITHVDLRTEWFLAANEVISGGIFAKFLDKPIEDSIEPGAQLASSFRNARSAINIGAELEIRKSLDFIDPVIEDMFVAFNGAIIWSRVSLDGGIQTSDVRSLQGQSPYLVNVQLGWDAPELAYVVASFQYFGRRIREAGALGIPDEYEESVPRLDVSMGYELGDGWKLTGKGRNLIDPWVRRSQGGIDTYRARIGRTFTVGVGKSF